MVKVDNNNKYDWFIDSGGLSHMTHHSDIVNNDAVLHVDSAREVNFNFSGNQSEVNDVLHLPNLAANLLSVANKVVKNENTVVFDQSGCRIFNVKKEVVQK